MPISAIDVELPDLQVNVMCNDFLHDFTFPCSCDDRLLQLGCAVSILLRSIPVGGQTLNYSSLKTLF